MKKRYAITIDGCDDSTTFEMELDQEQKKLVDDICRVSHEESSYRCQPTMSVEEI